MEKKPGETATDHEDDTDKRIGTNTTMESNETSVTNDLQKQLNDESFDGIQLFVFSYYSALIHFHCERTADKMSGAEREKEAITFIKHFKHDF